MLQPSALRRFPARDPNHRPTARVSGIKQGRRPSTTAGIDLTTSTTPATTTTVTSQRPLAGVASKRRPDKENIQNTLDAVIDILGLDKGTQFRAAHIALCAPRKSAPTFV